MEKLKERYTTLKEKKLIRLSQKGNEEAFEELIARNGKYMKGWIRSFVKGDENLVDEIFQQTLIKGWQKIGQFKFKSTFRTWVSAIARNNFYDEWRKRQRAAERFVSLDYNKDRYGNQERGKGHAPPKGIRFRCGEGYIAGVRVEAGWAGAGGLIDLETASTKTVKAEKKKENIKLGKSLLDQLKPKHREVLILYELDGLSYPEMAKALHIPVGTIMSRLYYGRIALTKAYKANV